MKKGLIYFLFFIVVFLTACSSQSEEKSSMDMVVSNESGKSVEFSEDRAIETKEMDRSEQSVKRKVIYKATLRMRVKNYQNSLQYLEEKAKSYGGYVIESNSYRVNNEQMSGAITLRIPQSHFQSYLNDTEGTAEEVLERNVNGQDVTEEYVDLESRLRSKRAVEDRLLDFMKSAQKTEDLLNISTDLGKVQEDIEQVVGRIKYLENQAALSTITVSLYEENVIVPNLEKDNLNTWDRTKKQFVTSTNFLLSAFSGVFVFFIGNVLIFLLIAFILTVLYVAIRKGKSNQSKTSKDLDRLKE
jgi:hypothetical protein